MGTMARFAGRVAFSTVAAVLAHGAAAVFARPVPLATAGVQTTTTGVPTTRSCPDDPALRAELSASTSRELAKGLFMVHVYGSDPSIATADAAAANLALYGQRTPVEVVKAWSPAGVILIDRNTQDTARSALKTRNVVHSRQLVSLTSALRGTGGDPHLLIAVDQEGGRVNRLASIVGKQPSAAVVGRTHAATVSAGRSTAAALVALGINVDFAPVADIVEPSTARTSIIGDRAYGTDPKLVADRVGAMVQTLQSRRVAAVAKHWPGHGSTSIDSHVSTPVLALTERQLTERDLRPFDAAVAKGVAAVMVGHLAVPVWDPSGRPATVSQPILSHLRAGFCGVVVSDSLWMGGVRNQGTDPEVALRALVAGVDLLLMPVDLAGSVQAIAAEADRDPLVRSRLIDAAVRVQRLRSAYAPK